MDASTFMPVVSEFLESRGFTITLIPRTNDKTPDCEIESGGESSLLELKLKGPDEDEFARETAAMATGAIVHRSEPLSPWGRLSNIVRDGAKQLQHHDPTNQKLHLVWLHSWGYQDELLEELTSITLFGRAKLVSESGFSGMKTCYFFRESSFFTLRNSLDAVISTRGEGHTLQLTFCVNTFSPRINVLRASRIFQVFQGGYTDPAALEATGDIWVADCDVPRKDEIGVLAYLRQKYGVDHLQVMPMAQIFVGANSEAWLRRKGGNPGVMDSPAQPREEV
jgi:hypothetical protein